MGAKRGEIWKVRFKNTEKLAVIVSADFRAESKLLTGIILTDNAFEVNAEFYTKGGLKYANPNAVSTIIPDNLIDYMRTASASEMDRLDEKLVNALGLDEYINDHFKNSCTVDVAEPQDVKPEPVKQEEVHIFHGGGCFNPETPDRECNAQRKVRSCERTSGKISQ